MSNSANGANDLLANGLDFIDDALEKLLQIENDTNNSGNRRLWKYTLLHLYAGIELVLKARLFQEHWTYIFADMNKANREALNNGDFISVGGKDLAGRLFSLCNIDIRTQERDCFLPLRNRRNKAEHFVMDTSDAVLETNVNASITAITEFITAHFN